MQWSSGSFSSPRTLTDMPVNTKIALADAVTQRRRRSSPGSSNANKMAESTHRTKMSHA
jgi:hypothetical protein